MKREIKKWAKAPEHKRFVATFISLQAAWLSGDENRVKAAEMRMGYRCEVKPVKELGPNQKGADPLMRRVIRAT